MKIKLVATIITIVNLAIVAENTYAEEQHPPNHEINLSPGLFNLLRAEMREIAGGVQGLALSIATGDWKSIQATSMNINASYIMDKKLTPAQAGELGKALPTQFKKLDADFHQRAKKLEAAAAAHDSELTAFHYSRLLETCASCHSAFASKRFPGFASPPTQDHHH